MSQPLVSNLGTVVLPPAPIRSSDPAQYQTNVEDWAREVERAVQQLAAKMAQIITVVNTL